MSRERLRGQIASVARDIKSLDLVHTSYLDPIHDNFERKLNLLLSDSPYPLLETELNDTSNPHAVTVANYLSSEIGALRTCETRLVQCAYRLRTLFRLEVEPEESIDAFASITDSFSQLQALVGDQYFRTAHSAVLSQNPELEMLRRYTDPTLAEIQQEKGDAL